MSDHPTLYDLFDETNLQYWKRQAENGNRPTREQLLALLEANAKEPLPSWLTPLLASGLRGELKGKRGRPKKSAYYQLCLSAAACEYRQMLKQIPQEGKLEGDSRPWQRTQVRAAEPAHEQAAKKVRTDWRLPISWRSFLNDISSEK